MAEISDFELAVLIGLVAGMRTSAPIVAMSRDPGKPWYALFGELCVDKCSFTPARTDAGGLIGRFATSIWASTRLARERRSSFVQAALVAGASALVATNALYEIRRHLGEVLHLPDFVIALVEDACVLRLIMHIRTSRGASVCR